MSKRIRILILLAAIILCVLAWLICRPDEPSYQGRTVSGWMMCLYRTRNAPIEASAWLVPEDAKKRPELGNELGLLKQSLVAIRQFGTNALPTLLQMNAAQDSSFKRKINALLDHQRFISFRFKTAQELREMSESGFRILRSEAKSATPELIRLLNGPEALTRRYAAINLGLIGPGAGAAVPSLVKCLNDPDPTVALNSLVALEQICEKRELLTPFLMNTLSRTQSNDMILRSSIIQKLGLMGPSASNAVPIIQSHLTNDACLVRDYASNALKKIDPTAAAKLGIQ